MDGTLDSPADPEATPDTDSPGQPRLVTVAEAAKRTGLSRVESRGELVQWQALYERERERAERTEADRVAIAALERQLREELLVLANAGPMRAMRLRREVRRRLATQHDAATAAVPATDPLPGLIAEA